MEGAIFTADIFSFLTVFIILLGIAAGTNRKTPKRTVFITSCIVSLVTIAADTATFFVIPNKALRHIVTLIAYAAPCVIIGIFAWYLYRHISEKTQASPLPFRIANIGAYILAGYTIVLSFFGYIFKFDEAGRSTFAGGYRVYLVSYFIIVLYLIAVMLAHSRKVGIHDTVSAVCYLVIPIVAMVVNAFLPGAEFSIPSIGISILIAYIMLQSDNERYLISKERWAHNKAYYDELTGVQNRLAYNKALEDLPETSIGVLFCDVNALKYTNDKHGHMAGDRLLVAFTAELKSCFRENDIYRISGDEFVVMVLGMTEDTFIPKAMDFEARLSADENPIACVGYAYGQASDVRYVTDVAEDRMYIAKKKYHEEHPQFNRENV